MSRIGKKEIKTPSGVKVEIAGGMVKVSGSKETLSMPIHPRVEVAWDESAREIRVNRKGDERLDRAMHGTTRSLIANMIQGVTQGYSRGLQVFGSGYGVKQEGQNLVLTVGTAKPFNVTIPGGITVEIKTPNARGNDVPAEFTVKGADKHMVGQFAAELRRLRPPEPYNGKGIRYSDEQIKKKVGKAFASGG